MEEDLSSPAKSLRFHENDLSDFILFVGARWASDLKFGASRPSLRHCVVFLDKKLYPTLSLSTQVYKMGTSNMLLGVTLQWTSIPSGGVVILSVALCDGNGVKFCPFGRSVTRVRLSFYVSSPYVVHTGCAKSSFLLFHAP